MQLIHKFGDYRGIQQTSLDAYESIVHELGDRQLQVYNALKTLGPSTNKMISAHLKLPINSITPRMLELREMKLVGVAFVSKDGARNAVFWKIIR